VEDAHVYPKDIETRIAMLEDLFSKGLSELQKMIPPKGLEHKVTEEPSVVNQNQGTEDFEKQSASFTVNDRRHSVFGGSRSAFSSEPSRQILSSKDILRNYIQNMDSMEKKEAIKNTSSVSHAEKTQEYEKPKVAEVKSLFSRARSVLQRSHYIVGELAGLTGKAAKALFYSPVTITKGTFTVADNMINEAADAFKKTEFKLAGAAVLAGLLANHFHVFSGPVDASATLTHAQNFVGAHLDAAKQAISHAVSHVSHAKESVSVLKSHAHEAIKHHPVISHAKETLKRVHEHVQHVKQVIAPHDISPVANMEQFESKQQIARYLNEEIYNTMAKHLNGSNHSLVVESIFHPNRIVASDSMTNWDLQFSILNNPSHKPISMLKELPDDMLQKLASCFKEVNEPDTGLTYFVMVKPIPEDLKNKAVECALKNLANDPEKLARAQHVISGLHVTNMADRPLPVPGIPELKAALTGAFEKVHHGVKLYADDFARLYADDFAR
jgi:hypothetical protein